MKRLLVLLALVLLPAALPAQSSPPETEGARAAVLGYLNATREGDWTRMASFVHPESLTRFRAVVDRNVAEDSTGMLLSLLLGLESAAELKAMTDAEVFALFFSRQLGSPQVREEMAGIEFEITGATLQEAGSARVEYVMRKGAELQSAESMEARRLEDGRWLVIFPEG